MPLARSSPAEVVWHVENLDEVPLIQARAQRFLSDRGFDIRSRWCVLIAASELATNAIKYAGGGVLSLEWVAAPPPHVRLEVIDCGPGIDDLDRARIDFVSEGLDLREVEYVLERKGNGTGLGSVARLMDSHEIVNRSTGGLRVVACKYLR